VLLQAQHELIDGAKDYQRIELDAMSEIARHGWKVDYIAVRRQSDLQPAKNGEHELVVVAAARLGRTRLIDNVEVVRS
jgi:pantoate--beta-alanine ligase